MKARQKSGQSQSREDLAGKLWRRALAAGDAAGLRRVRTFLDAFGAGEAVPPTDLRQRSSPGRFFPGLEASPWYDPKGVPGAAELGRAFRAIEKDYLRMRRTQIPFVSYGDADDHAVGATSDVHSGRQDDVDVFITHLPEQVLSDRLALCPGVRRALAGSWFADSSMFSVLTEGNFVGPHSDFFNYMLTLHLGIWTPAGAGIRVGGEASWWTKGECLVFDASYVHEVWNQGPGDRVVLIVNAWHPDLTSVEVEALREIRPEIRRWEKASVVIHDD